MIFDFNELAGNAVTIALVKRALARGAFRQVSMFSGPRGTGKSSSANAVAMALTCESPVDGLACGKCQTCQMNKKALASSGASSTVKVVNLGKMNKSEDVSGLVKDVFELQNVGRNQVYLFEEVHALKGIKNGFTALLSEIDRMAPNTFIVMCTTNPSDVDEALRSRALQFEFKRLTAKESMVLAQRLVEHKGMRVPEKTLELLVRYCKGIPREIEKLVDFVTEVGVSYEEVQEFLQCVSNSVLIEMFSRLKSGDVTGGVEVAKSLLERCSPWKLVDALKSWMVDVVLYVESGHSDVFTVGEKKGIREVFSPGMELTRVVQCIEKLGRGSSESDVVLTILKIGSLMQGKSENSVVARKASTAAREEKCTQRSLEERKGAPEWGSGLTTLTTKSLESFGGI